MILIGKRQVENTRSDSVYSEKSFYSCKSSHASYLAKLTENGVKVISNGKSEIVMFAKDALPSVGFEKLMEGTEVSYILGKSDFNFTIVKEKSSIWIRKQ